MAEQDQSYRKKQAYLVLLVFACIGVSRLGAQRPGGRGRHPGGLRHLLLRLHPGAGKKA